MSLSSIDIDGLSRLIDRLDRAADDLHRVATELRAHAARERVSVAATHRMVSVASWATAELPGLRRRLELAHAADAQRPVGQRGQVVTLGEPVLSPDEAARRGRELAELLEGIDTTGPEGQAQLHELAEQLETIEGDPAAAAAFWAAAGTYWTDTLPDWLAGSETAASDFAVFSSTFTTALHCTNPPAGFTGLVETFSSPPDDVGQAWSRLALLQHGAAPTDALVDITRANALDQFTAEQVDTYDSRAPFKAQALGLPESTYSLAFRALAQDPDAVRRAIPPGERADMATLVYEYGHLFDTGGEVADAFGQAVLAGAGALDELPGEHSPAAVAFAFQIMTATAAYEDDGAVPWEIKDSFAELAVSYAPELLAGASISDASGHGSTIGAPENWSPVLGLDPHFYLSVEDTQRFLQTFGDTDELALPFDEAVQVLYEDLLTQAAQHDAQYGTEHMPESAYAFGNLAAVEYLAQKEVRAAADEAEKAARELVGDVLGLGLGEISPTGRAVSLVWKAVSFALDKIIDDWAGGDPEATRVALLENAEVQAAFLRDYEAYRILAAAVPAHEANLPTELRGPDGHILPASDIAADGAKLEAFAAWLDSQDQGNGEGTTDDVVEEVSGGFSAGFHDAQTEVGNEL